MSKKEFNARPLSTGSTLICARGSLQWRLRTWLMTSEMESNSWLFWRFSAVKGCPWREVVYWGDLTISATSILPWSFSGARGWVVLTYKFLHLLVGAEVHFQLWIICCPSNSKEVGFRSLMPMSLSGPLSLYNAFPRWTWGVTELLLNLIYICLSWILRI